MVRRRSIQKTGVQCCSTYW
uniref:Uncharacterized protein n=1 Tax=Arundo donax TaxID=35708 RepID=A0A0A9F7G1_ARUDO